MAAASASSGTENWDDDFVFGNGSSPKAQAKARTSTTSTPSRRVAEPADNENTVRASPRRQHPPTLATWAEPGPSTPPKQRHAPTPVKQEENWDDDFEDHDDNVESPVSPSSARPKPVAEPENWDDDFEEQPAHHAHVGDWDSSDEEDNFADQEDRTVTARNRRALMPKNTHHSPPPPLPPLPPLPPSQIPGSPAFSTFSMPASSHRDSIGYASLSHVPLRAGSTSALAMLPPSPPVQRERRRLRKKSRPTDNNVFELLERTQDIPEDIPSPPRPSPPDLPPALPPQPPEQTPAKPALLTRGIGSVKKWGARRKRMSTGPSDVIENEATPRASTSQQHQQRSAHSSPSSRQTSGSSSGWFFRNSGGQQHGAEHASGSPPAADASSPSLKRQRSVAFAGANQLQDSPTKKGKRAGQAAVLGRRPVTPASSEGELPPSPARRGQRPASMHMPPSQQSGKPPFPRQTSHGAYALGRTSSRSTFSASTDDVHSPVLDEGSSGGPIIRGIRRISLVGRHKRNKSASGSTAMNEAPPLPNPMPQLPVPQTPGAQSELLPPIELQPPSPPRVGGMRNREASESTVGSTDTNDTIESLLLRPSQEAARSAPHLPTPQSSPGRTVTPRASPTKMLLSSIAGGSPQSASLGRATQPPVIGVEVLSNEKDKVPRRNSLGDLKIPSRISAAQVGLKQNMTMVREFSTSVERLKGLLASYASLTSDADAAVSQIEAASASARPPSRAMSPPAIFKSSKSKARTRSNTNPDPSADPFVLAYYRLDAQYRLTWECAELLVELGTGSGNAGTGGGQERPGSMLERSGTTGTTSRKNRERAVTLAGDEPGPPPLPATALGWRASTGRSDLSQRQLSLLKEMLNKDSEGSSPPSLMNLPEELVKMQGGSSHLNRSWRWGEGMSSTVTLPSEESGASGSGSNGQGQGPSRLSQKTPTKKPSRLGMRGLRDMLKSLTSSNNNNSNSNSNHSQSMHSGSPRFATMSASVSTESSLNLHLAHLNQQGLPRPPSRQDSGHDTNAAQRRRAKTSAGPSSSTSSIRAASPPMPIPTPKSGSQSFAHKSPRRPSIASIFRFAHKDKDKDKSNRASPSHDSGALPQAGTSSGDNSEEDWDRLDEYDIDMSSTVRGRKERAKSPFQPPPLPPQPVTPRKTGSRSSLSLPLFNNNDSQISLGPGPSSATIQPPAPAPAPILVASALPPHALAFTRPTRLSNVEETAEHSGAEAPPARPMVPASVRRGSQRSKTKKRTSQSPHRPLTGSASTSRSGSVRGGNPTMGMTPAALALAPENIRPLVESAREVLGKCSTCVEELRMLLDGRPGVVAQVRV
ncbi:unnamed protein product [Peniophora sp. CBMAI 1063]|nr:unnamed protein product [Peniophora sp. CBMAI 1063]